VRSADLELAGRVADLVVTALRKDPALKTFLDANLEFQGDVARSVYTTCAALGRREDLRFLRARFAAMMLSALDAPFLNLREEGRYRDVLERLRSAPAEVAAIDVPVGDYVLRMSPGLGTAAVRIRVAGALQDLGRYEEAFACVDEALRTLDTVPHHLASYPHCLHAEMRACGQLASALLHRGLVSEARAVAARAHALELLIPVWLPRSLTPSGTYYLPDGLRVLPAWRPPEHRVRATLHEGRIAQIYARCLEADGAPEEALAVLEAAVGHMQTHFGVRHPRRAELLQELAAAYLRAGEAEKARSAVSEAIEIVEAALSAEHPQVADMRLTLGDIHLLQGRFGDAIAAYRKSLAITESALFETHMNHIRARSGIALAHARDGRVQNALMPMREAVARLVRRIEVDAQGASNPDRLALVGATHWVLANWIDVSRSAGIDGYAEVLRLRGIAARSLAEDRRAFLAAPEKARVLFEELHVAQRKLARILHAHTWSRWQRLAWRREVATQAAACDAILRKLNKVARKSTDRRRLVVKPKAICARLRKNEALVDIVLAGGTYTAWILTKGAEPRRVEVGDGKAIDEAVSAFRDAIYDAETRDDRHYLVSGAHLRDLLWAPIAGALPAEATTLYVVPDGAVAAVPLGAMPAIGGRGVVGERYLLAYLAYPQALIPHGGPRVRGRGLVVMGDVDYNEAQAEDGVKRPVITGRALADLPNGIPRFNALPASGAEADWVRTAVQGSSRRGPTTHLQGSEATEGRLRKHVPGRSILHLATHGYVRKNVDGAPDVPQGEAFRLQPGLELHAHRFDPFLMSGLVLAGANVRIHEGEDDGILTALEASQLDLRAAELVVLSACQTAEGIDQAGEGSIGLVRGFTLAGARNVVGSLWKVEDAPTRKLMEKFYRRFLRNKSTSAAAALRESALAMRRGELGDAGTRPVNWAAFVAYGPLR